MVGYRNWKPAAWVLAALTVVLAFFTERKSPATTKAEAALNPAAGG